MKTCALYDMLRNSPLACNEDAVSLEEVAIWLDMNFSALPNVMNLLKAIEKHYHDFRFDRFDASARMSSSIAAKSICTPVNFSLNSQDHNRHLSNRVLRWLFKAISCTDVLDDAVLSKKFLRFATKARNMHREKTVKHKKLPNAKTSLPLPSKVHADLYEIFAELVDIVEDKMHRSK